MHRDVAPDTPASGRGSRSASAAPVEPPASPPMHYLRERSYSPADEPQSPGPPANPVPRTIYNAFPMSYHTPYPTPMPYGMSDTASLITNMAVSSLRTELPHSPSADPRRGGPLY